MSDDIETARRSALRAARTLWPSDTPLDVVTQTLQGAERAVARRLLSRLLPDGEVGFWRLVEEEVRG